MIHQITKHLPVQLALVVTVCALSACGGGGGGGGDGFRPDNTPPPPTTPVKTFTVSLDSIDVRRASNGEPITVDVTTVSSGSLSFQ